MLEYALLTQRANLFPTFEAFFQAAAMEAMPAWQGAEMVVILPQIAADFATFPVRIILAKA